jgi:hypothetical protein
LAVANRSIGSTTRPPIDWRAEEEARREDQPRSWQEDLYHLLTDIHPDPVGAIAQSTPGQAAIGALTSGPAQATFAALDVPARGARELVGQTVNVLQGEGLGPVGSGQAEWDESIQGLRNADMGALGIAKGPLELALNLGVDPLSYAGPGILGKGAKGLAAAGEAARAAGRPVLGTALRGAALPLQGMQAVNDLPGRVILPPLQAGVRQVGRGITRISPDALKQSQRSRVQALDDALEMADVEEISGRAPDPINPSPDRILPINETPIAPIPPHPHPPGSAPDIAYGRAQSAWSRLWARMNNRPVLGLMPGTEGARTYTGRGRTGFYDPGIERWSDPADVRLSDPIVSDMADVGVAIMLNVANSGGLFPSLTRAHQGTRAIRESLVERYGRGIEPYIPTIYTQMREQLGDQADAVMPASRFLLPWGWAEEVVGGKEAGKRLAAHNEAIRKATTRKRKPLTMEEARAQELGKARKYPYTSPQEIEAAAAMGSGMLSMFRNGADTTFEHFTPGGAYFPTTEAGITNQVAAFRDELWEGTGHQVGLGFDLSDAGKLWGVSQPFGSTREAWNSYMRTTFGGALADDELDTLADISADVLYHQMMNAAGPVSAGGAGARTLVGMVDDAGRISDEGLSESYTKISPHARSMEDIGSESMQGKVRLLESMGAKSPLHGKFDKTYGRIGDTGLDAVLGARRNPKGGPIPNLAALQRYWAVGADLVTSPFSVARDWYQNGAREIVAVSGRGNYESAQILLNSIGITSAGTDVWTNVTRALRVKAEWMFGKDDTMRKDLGITGNELDRAMNESLLLPDLASSQKGLVRKMFQRFVDFRDPGVFRTNIQGGPKTHNYAGSFLVNIWRDQMDLAIKNAPDNALLKQARQDLDDALAIYTVDRHANRIDNLATAVSDLDAYFVRERGILGARSVSTPEDSVSGEEFQAGLWFWSRDRQGFVRELNPGSDITYAIRTLIDRTYNEGRVPPEEFMDILRRFVETDGMDEDQALDEAYNLIGQEVSRRALAKSFDAADKAGRKAAREAKEEYDPDLHNPLAKAGFPTTLEEFGRDALGFMQRGSFGLTPSEWADPLAASIQLQDALVGLPGGGTLRYVDGSWQPTTDQVGVPLKLSARFDPTKPIGARRAVEKLLTDREVRDAFDPTVQYGAEESLGFMLVPDPDGKVRAAVALLGGDPANLPGDLTNRPLSDVLNEFAGPLSGRPRFAAEELRRRQATLAELDLVNPISIFRRKVVQPLMNRYARTSLVDGTEQITGKRLEDIGVPDWPERVAEGDVHFDPALSLNSNAALNTKLKDGKTYRTFMTGVRKEAAADRETLAAAGVSWAKMAPAKDRLKAANGKADLEKIIRTWNDRGLDVLNASDERSLAREVLSRQIAKDEGIDHTRTTIPGLLKAAWGETVLLSGRYLAGNLEGNWLALAMTGTKPPTNFHDYAAVFQAARNGADITRDDVIQSTHAAKIANDWGLAAPPGWLARGGTKAMVGGGESYHSTAVGELTGRITKSAKAARVVGSAFKLNNDLALSIDTVARFAKWEDVFDQKMREYLPAWEGEVNRVGGDIEGFEFSIIGNINAPQSRFYEDIREHLVGMGMTDGQAQHLAQTFISVRAKALADAKKDVNRTLFSYADRTNLDEWVGKFVPFHYWYTRALRFWGEELIRNPGIALNYMRLTDGMEDAQNDPGLSARQKGFIKLMGTPLGFSLLFNPDALFGVVKVLNLNDAYGDDGMTEMGQTINWMKERGFGIYPWIDGTINMMGMYGNTFEPDLLGIRHKALVGSAINFLRAHAGFDPAGAPYADAMGQVRYSVSSFVSSFTPDWLSQPVTPRAGGSSQEATLDTVIESAILENNPGLTNEELLGIMTDREHPEYQRAFQQAADAGIIQQLLNFTLPMQFRMRHDGRDVRTAQVAEIEAAAREKGVAPFRFTPTPGDITFAARYKSQTGKDWTPGDYQDAKVKHDLVRAPEEAKTFILQEATYNTLGDPKDRKLMDRYHAIRNGQDPLTVNEPDPSIREDMAQRWLEVRGAGDTVNTLNQLKNDYEASHPELAQFKAWQGRMYQIAAMYGSLGEYRRQAIQQNPNFARYWARTEVWVQQNFPQEEWEAQYDRSTLNAAAFMAIHGQPEYRSVEGPIPGVPAYDPTMPNLLATGPPAGGGAPDWLEELRRGGSGPAGSRAIFG